MKVLILGVNSFNSKAGKPCFQVFASMPNSDGRGFSPTITAWAEPLEYQAMERLVPCWATADQSIEIDRLGKPEVRLRNFREYLAIVQDKATAKAS